MKTQIDIAKLLLSATLGLVLAAVPAAADNTLYSNGKVNGNGGGWDLAGGSTVSDSINLNTSRSNTYSIGFDVWELPGDSLLSVDWSITSQEDGGTVYASGTATTGNYLKSTFLFTNKLGYDIDLITVSGLNVSLDAGTYWLNLQNAVSAQGGPVYWDENSGPSQASESSLGTIPSESFEIDGSTDGGTAPEPNTLLLLGSGVLGLGGLLRKRLTG